MPRRAERDGTQTAPEDEPPIHGTSLSGLLLHALKASLPRDKKFARTVQLLSWAIKARMDRQVSLGKLIA